MTMYLNSVKKSLKWYASGFETLLDFLKYFDIEIQRD